MTHVTNRTWTAQQIDLLISLVNDGVSAARASVILKRPKLGVQSKARQLGKPFPHLRAVRKSRLAREARALEMIDNSGSA